MGYFYKKFIPIWVALDIISNEDWVPALMLTYKWTIKDADITVRFTICNNEIWHSPNSVDKYYCQNLNGRNANAKSQIHS